MEKPVHIRVVMHALRKHRWQLISEWPPAAGEQFMFHLFAGRHHESTRNMWASDGFRRVPYLNHFIILLPSWFESELEKQCNHEMCDKKRKTKTLN